MKRFGAQLNKKAQNIRLSMAERAVLRDRVVSYMEYHPLPKEKTATAPVLELTSDPYKALNFSRVQFGSFIGAFAMLVLVVIPVVAEQAVPGDVLYPVKVQFNEEVRSTLSFSPYAKVEWETERLERRLAEARLLADEGKLTEEIEAEVAQAVQEHSNAAQESIATIRSSDSDEAALAEITFASALEVQSEVLANREGQSGETGRSVAALVDAVTEARNGVAASNNTANPSFEKLFARLESETTYAEELFTSVQTEATPEQTRDIKRRFEDIKRKTNEAANLHSGGATTTDSPAVEKSDDIERQAKQILKDALTDTRKLISFMTDIEVRSSVTIDELVPVTLTKEEQKAALGIRLNELSAAQVEIERLVVDSSVAAKFNEGRERFFVTLEDAKAAFAANDPEFTTELVEEAELMAKDLKIMGVLISTTTDKATSTSALSEDESEATTTTADAEDDEAATSTDTD